MRRIIVTMTLIVLGIAGPLLAQQTTGNISGRLVDAQGSGVPGVTVTAKNTQTGLTRTENSDAEGVYRLTALPVGIYDITAELQGFSKIENKGIVVNVGQTLDVNMTLKMANLSETVTVTGETPLIETSSSSVGGVVDIRRIESLPLNGRQFANLAATIPGVGLGFHSDPTKSTQYAPQINGGAGRNVNYQIDGGDNNDDTVGGLLQAYPLEAIQEFNFVTQRFKAEYGRSNGGVMNIVTKSGTNDLRGSFFESFRDKSMNARTQTEKIANRDKQDYRRNQFGGSFGGPIARDKAHFFGAVERTQQDTTQTVNTKGLFPSLDGAAPVPYRETLLTGKVTASLNASQYMSVRYGYNKNTQPYNVAGASATPDNWGDSINKFNSINLNHNWVLPGQRLNEFVFQYADFGNNIASRSSAPNETFPNGVRIGANVNTPQTTEQKKYQFRDDFSWHVSGMGGLGHDFKAGVNYINEPRLYLTFNSGKGAIFNTHLTDDPNGAIQTVTVSDGNSSANVPTKQFGTYVQDDWRATPRLTLNLGLRYDIVDGYAFDQSKNPNFVAVAAAAKAGLLTGIQGLENMGLSSQNDRNNIQPRVGGAYDVRGDGKDVIRAGWGIYTDFGYSNSNVLFAATDSSGSGFGQIFSVDIPTGIRNPDGSFYRAGQPLSNIQSQNQVTAGAAPLVGQWVDPRLQQPWTRQANAGWSHELMPNTIVNVDYVRSIGGDLNYRPRINQRIAGTSIRRLAALVPTLSPNVAGTRAAVSRGRSEYNALILSGRRRLSHGLDFTASYTLSEGKSTIGTAADELNVSNIQDPNNPFDDPRQFGPNLTTDARHRLTASAIWQAPYGITVAPFFLFRSALPVSLIDGRDLNLDGDIFDIPTTAYRVTGYNADTHAATIEAFGDCKTVNCGRALSQSQFNIRFAKSFPLRGRMRVEALADVFNLFNALNPSYSTTATNRRVLVPTTGAADPTLLQPDSFSGDVQRPEQRTGQIGFRFSF